MAKRKKKSMSRSTSKSSSSSCSTCNRSSCRCWGWVIALLGLVYLLQDLGYLAQWGLNWPLNWWTVLFLLLGAKKIMMSR